MSDPDLPSPTRPAPQGLPIQIVSYNPRVLLASWPLLRRLALSDLVRPSGGASR